ncbi:MAG: L-tyrosine/L-tryptophan isonitrile synthase family protein [Polyangiaceae bacterium]|nr:L-tyrosine/L-tryptophan isonitrile synthase family protein [Polyangiaceae bacterium]
MTATATHRQTRAYRSQLRVTEAAFDLIREGGWSALSIAGVAGRAGVSVGLVCRNFPTRDHFALALYEQLADALVDRVGDLPEGTVARRFAAAMRWKLELLAPHRDVLIALAGVAIDPSARAGVLSAASQRVRAKVAGVFELVASGATDVPDEEGARRLARLLYGAHLFIVLLWSQLPEGTAIPLDMIEAQESALGPYLQLAAHAVDPTLQALLGAPTLPDHGHKADAILGVILARRRSIDPSKDAASDAPMRALHRASVQAAIDRQGPIELVLPAFPAKAPNPAKVLGKRPDMAEWLALRGLFELLEEIAAIHSPGAELVLCSDGGVFADLVGVSDADVRAYRTELEAMIARLEDGGPKRIRVFDLDDAIGGRSAPANRQALIERYASNIDALKARAVESPTLGQMIDGIHRFLFEDEIVRSPGMSRSQARKATRERAYETVLRSEAWGALVGVAFPSALRLSIHPQPPVSSKIGVHFIDTDDAWLTPWHGAAVLAGERFRLDRRARAESQGAERRETEDGLAYLEVVP